MSLFFKIQAIVHEKLRISWDDSPSPAAPLSRCQDCFLLTTLQGTMTLIKYLFFCKYDFKNQG
jgi:hypothetical protein